MLIEFTCNKKRAFLRPFVMANLSTHHNYWELLLEGGKKFVLDVGGIKNMYGFQMHMPMTLEQIGYLIKDLPWRELEDCEKKM